MLTKLIIMILNPVRACYVRLSAFMLMADEKKRNRESQHAHLVLNMNAYIPIRTETGKYNSTNPLCPSAI